MPTTRREPAQYPHLLTPGERDWIRRQGRASRELEAHQRHLAPAAKRPSGPTGTRRSAPPAQ
jgi:hypothetical protein